MIYLLMGYPASGKSTLTHEYTGESPLDPPRILSRDKAGRKVIDLLPRFSALLNEGPHLDIILDNTFPTAESRKPFIEAATKVGRKVCCLWLKTSIEDAQFNACTRMVRKYGKLLSPNEIKQQRNDPNCFPPAVLFKYRKQFELPTKSEGFDDIRILTFRRKPNPAHFNKAVIFDYDDTLRITKGGGKWPTDPSQVTIIPGRKGSMLGVLGEADSFIFLGISNQSDVSKGNLTAETAEACFDKTNEMLGVDIDYAYCPHGVPPITCWCRKPMPGLGVQFIEKYKLDPAKCIMVGDQTSDKTFASRCGFQFIHADQFFL